MKLFAWFKFQRPPLWYGITRSVFRISTIAFVVILLIEVIEPGFVTNWFNPIWLLILAILSGIIVVSNQYD